MSASATVTASSSSGYNNAAFWERLWRQNATTVVVFFIVAYVLYGTQPNVGAPADTVTAFYLGSRTRILLALLFAAGNVLNLLWFAAALRTTLADAGRDGWGSAATAASSTLGALFLMLVTISATLAYSIAVSGASALVSGLNDIIWALVVFSSFPRAMLIMSGTFGLWRSGRISNALFGAGIAAVVLVLLGGFAWMGGGVLAPDGAFSRYVSPLICLVWIAVFGRVLQNSPATRAGW
jgi:hypothetical protein